MPNNPPILITRVLVGKGAGMVLVSMACPSGELGRGPVENVEAIRVAMTLSTFKEVAELFSHTMAEIQGDGSEQKIRARRRAIHAVDGRSKN